MEFSAERDGELSQTISTDRGEATLLARALLAYVRRFDKQVLLEDIVTGLPVKVDAFSADYVPRALNRLGLTGEVRRVKTLMKAAFPVCALLKDDRFVVILGRNDGVYQIEEPEAFKGMRDVSCKDIEASFSGEIIVAGVSFSELERKYIGKKQKGHWFWSHFRNHKGLISHIILGTFVANMLAIGISLFALQVYDRVIPNQSEATLWVLFTGVLIAIIFEGLLRVARATLIDVTGREIEISVSTWLFQKLQGMKLSRNKMGPGSLLYAVREFSSVREFFTNSTMSSMADIPFVFIFLALIYFIAGPVVLIAIVAMALIVIPSLLAQKKMMRLNDEMLGGTSASNKVLIETTYSQETIKALRAESHFQNQWEDLLLLNSDKLTEQRLLTAKLQYWAMSMQQAAYISSIVACSYLVFSGDLTLGAIIAISILSSRALSPVTGLSSTLTRWHQVKSALNMMEDIANSEQDVDPDKTQISADSLSGNYTLETVGYAYHEEAKPVLDIPRLELTAGESIGLLGANGSGKTTLLRLLAGLSEPTAGKITIDGLLISQVAPWDLRRHVGYLPQEIRLFQGTLRENLEMVEGQKPDSVLFEALEFCGLSHFVKSHPQGLDMEISDGGSGVSIGQKQSIGLARLYLQDPTIVLLDEPTASFDQALEAKIIQNLRKWLVNKTCVLTTHRPAVLSIVSKIIVMQNGKIAMYDDTKTVIEKLSTPSKKAVPASASRPNRSVQDMQAEINRKWAAN